ncbi:MAG: hypothetical protein GX567_00090, partial [Clostridia bacterium]|nr:hypothetical protein [Clostridia bacterium]
MRKRLEKMTVTINAGYAWIDGYAYHLDDTLEIELETASGNMDRIDNIVLRLDTANRWIKAFVVTGSYYSTNPVAPEIQRTATVDERCIAQISVARGTTAITQEMITDTRMDAEK